MIPGSRHIELPLLNELTWVGGGLELAIGLDERDTLFHVKLPMYFDDLTSEDLADELQSGVSRWENRVHNARMNLVKKGQLEDLAEICRLG